MLLQAKQLNILLEAEHQPVLEGRKSNLTTVPNTRSFPRERLVAHSNTEVTRGLTVISLIMYLLISPVPVFSSTGSGALTVLRALIPRHTSPYVFRVSFGSKFCESGAIRNLHTRPVEYPCGILPVQVYC